MVLTEGDCHLVFLSILYIPAESSCSSFFQSRENTYWAYFRKREFSLHVHGFHQKPHWGKELESTSSLGAALSTTEHDNGMHLHTFSPQQNMIMGCTTSLMLFLPAMMGHLTKHLYLEYHTLKESGSLRKTVH